MDGKRVRARACLFVGDMERMVRFYRDVLGLRTDWAGGHFAEFETAGGPTTLFMDSRREFARAIDQAYTPPRPLWKFFFPPRSVRQSFRNCAYCS